MDALTGKNRILKTAIVLLLCVAGVQLAIMGERKPGSTAEPHGAVQRLPGPGSGVVDVKVVNDVRIAQQGAWRVAQQGDWRVTQQGDWRVGVQGSVTTVSAQLPFIKAGGTYAFQWSRDWTELGTVREVQPNGWLRVGSRWVNTANAISIEPR